MKVSSGAAVVRDLGAALGKTGRFWPIRRHHAVRARLFIRGVTDGYVEFDYQGFHKELIRRRITPDGVTWAIALAGRLSLQQWQDAFRAGGYEPEVGSRFIATIRDRIVQARLLVGGGAPRQNGGV
jgi:hypothetical protein